MWKILILGIYFESRANKICRWIKCRIKRKGGMKVESQGFGLSTTRRVGFHGVRNERLQKRFALGYVIRLLLRAHHNSCFSFLFF